MSRPLKYILSGRLAFLDAINEVSPSLLSTLSTCVPPMKRFLRDIEAHKMHGGNGPSWSDFNWESLLKEKDRALRIRTALERWAGQHKVVDTWIMDAALQTIAKVAIEKETTPRYWMYRPPGNLGPRFTPRFKENEWEPEESVPWSDFAALMRSQFSKQLTAYRETVKTTSFFLGNAGDENAARWVAEYVVNRKSWDRIAKEVENSSDLHYEEPKSAVVKSATRFAERIGLTLPDRPAGRRRKQNLNTLSEGRTSLSAMAHVRP